MDQRLTLLAAAMTLTLAYLGLLRIRFVSHNLTMPGVIESKAPVGISYYSQEDPSSLCDIS